MKAYRIRFSFFLLIPLILFISCASSISLYDQHAYAQVTSLKVDALHVIDLSRDPFEKHQKEAEEVIRSLEKAKEYELHRPKNKISAEMWKLILDPNEGSFGGFIEFWKAQSADGKKIGQTYITNKKKQVGEHFDRIAELESKKIKK